MKWSALKIALISVISLSQILLLTFFLTYKNLNIALGSWSENTNLTIYLKTDTTEPEKNQLIQFLKKVDERNHVVVTSRDQAAKEFKKSIGSYAGGLMSDDELIDLIPETIELVAPKNFSLDEKINLFQKVSSALSKFTTVEESVFGMSWLQRFSKVDKYIQTLGLGSFIVLLLAMGFLSALMVKVLVEDSRAEVEVFNLLGATRWSIYKIYIKDISLTVLLSLAMTFTITYGLYFVTRSTLLQSEFGRFVGERIYFLNPQEIATFVVAVIAFVYSISVVSMVSSLNKLSHLTYD